MFNGLGFDEMFLVALIGILFVKPQQLGQLLRWVRTTRAKLAHFQYDLEEKVQSFVNDDLGMKPDLLDFEPPKSPPQDFRLTAKHRLSQLDEEDKLNASELICTKVSQFEQWEKAKNIACFHPMKTEPDLLQFLSEALEAGKNLFFPWIDEEKQSIHLAPIKNFETDLQKGAFGILEPRTSLRESSQTPTIELFLVPGVAFGLDGERLGHGKGFYDRLLSQHANAFKVGVAFEEQVFSETLPQEPHDIRMNALVTPVRRTLFGKTT